jgi:hypothetical protein
VEPSRRTRGALLLLAPILVVAVIAGIVSFSSRGDAAFVYKQLHPGIVGAEKLELLIKDAREPTPEGPGSAARTVRCTPVGNSQRRTAWRCAVLYRSGKTIRYDVKIKPDGSYTGVDRSGQFLVSGCCVTGASASG